MTAPSAPIRQGDVRCQLDVAALLESKGGDDPVVSVRVQHEAAPPHTSHPHPHTPVAAFRSERIRRPTQAEGLREDAGAVCVCAHPLLPPYMPSAHPLPDSSSVSASQPPAGGRRGRPVPPPRAARIARRRGGLSSEWTPRLQRRIAELGGWVVVTPPTQQPVQRPSSPSPRGQSTHAHDETRSRPA